jgi:hypothetical protein
MPSNPATEVQPTVESRLHAFAAAFKGYMAVMPLVIAALAPLLTFLKALPTYESQRTTLASLSGILGFLLLAWLFYIRRTLALGSLVRGFRALINTLPLLLIVGTVASFIGYFHVLGVSTTAALEQANKKQWTYVVKDQKFGFETGSDVLKHWDDRPVTHAVWLQLLYLAIFLSAECAFVMMALREYINDTRHVSELEWMFGKQDAAALNGVQQSIQARIQQEAAPPTEK